MSVYAITGELGTGKSLLCVTKIREALLAGKRVATNLDLRLEHLVGGKRPRDVLRIPDHPRAEDFEALGKGCDVYDEERFGLIVIDEAATFLNARESLRDPLRAGVIKWLLHSRKWHWDVFLIIQDLSMLDKQVRTAFVEHLVKCKRADRINIPILSPILEVMGFNAVKLAKFHFAIVKYGTGAHSLVVARWLYTSRGGQNYKAYDTQQKLVSRVIAQVYTKDGPPKVNAKTGEPDREDLVLEKTLATQLCPNRAPWLAEPKGLREWAYNACSDWSERSGWVGRAALAVRPPMSPERARYLDFKLAEAGHLEGLPKREPTFDQWWLPLHTTLHMGEVLRAERAGRPGALGEPEGLGEAPEPANHYPLQDAAD